MHPWLAALIILGAAAVSAAGMLVVRRRAPEATATLAMFHAAGAFSPEARARLEAQVVCYAREVISDGWPAMRDGHGSPAVDARVRALEESAERIQIRGAKQIAAYDDWFTLSEERRKGRQGRIAAASPLVPPVIWLILILGAVVVIAAVGFFADSREAAVPQAAMIAAVAVIVTSGLVLVRFLDNPYEDRSGSIKPTAMERTLELIEGEPGQSPRELVPCS